MVECIIYGNNKNCEVPHKDTFFSGMIYDDTVIDGKMLVKVDGDDGFQEVDPKCVLVCNPTMFVI
mgnify:CR=1 FL=1|tara:strand:- start:577 stop:771 length:195 start_codon:yes stop_codon:yes gene_type:complete